MVAAAINQNTRPGSSSEERLYGMVTGYVGTRQNKNGDDLWVYTVTCGRDEDVQVAVDDSNNKLVAGNLIMFEETASGEYVMGTDLWKLLTGDGTVEVTSNLPGDESLELAAIRSYDSSKGLLTYFSSTSRLNNTQDFSDATISTPASATVSKNVKLVYVDADKGEAGDDIGVATFDASTGYANAMLHYNDKGVVDAIIIETSTKGNLATVKSSDAPNTEGSQNFGVEAGMRMPATLAVAGNQGQYEVTANKPAGSLVAKGEEVTLTIKCTEAHSQKVTIKLTGSDITDIGADVEFDTTDTDVTKTIKFKVNDNTNGDLTVTLTATV